MNAVSIAYEHRHLTIGLKNLLVNWSAHQEILEHMDQNLNKNNKDVTGKEFKALVNTCYENSN